MRRSQPLEIWGKDIPGVENCKCKGSVIGTRLSCFRGTMECGCCVRKKQRAAGFLSRVISGETNEAWVIWIDFIDLGQSPLSPFSKSKCHTRSQVLAGWWRVMTGQIKSAAVRPWEQLWVFTPPPPPPPPPSPNSKGW